MDMLITSFSRANTLPSGRVFAGFYRVLGAGIKNQEWILITTQIPGFSGQL